MRPYIQYPKVVAFLSQKGGVGKSTMAVTAAGGLAAKGWRVGLIDTDDQGGCSFMLDMPEADGLYSVMVNQTPLPNWIQEVPPERWCPPGQSPEGALYLLPSTENTYQIPLHIPGGRLTMFMAICDQFINDYNLDIIILDTCPSIHLMDPFVLMACDGYMLVTEASGISASRINKLLDFADGFVQDRAVLGRETRLFGIQPNKLRSRTRAHREVLNVIAQNFDNVWSPIYERVAWTNAANNGMVVTVLESSSQAAREAWQFINHLEKEVLTWTTQPTE